MKQTVVYYRGYKLVNYSNARPDMLICRPDGSRMAMLPSIGDAFEFIDGCLEQHSIIQNNPLMGVN